MVNLSIPQNDPKTKRTDKSPLKYADCCQICGGDHQLKRVDIIHGKGMYLCADCAKLFFAADEGQGGKDANI